MKPHYLLILSLLLLNLSCSQSVFVVRHAEKAAPSGGNMMSSDVPLSEAGVERAALLRDLLRNKDIQSIYSTNTLRTRSTAMPLSEALNIPIQLYHPRDTLQQLAASVRSSKGSVLLVGHSNTVDDLVNIIAGKNLVPADLPETVYDRMFILSKKKSGMRFKQKSYGKVYP